jgi:signal transduction histidine kinase
VEVALTFSPGSARLSVHDSGKGFDLPANPAELSRTGHYGLANMQERANKVSGTIRVESAPGMGTRIDLTVHAGEEKAR